MTKPFLIATKNNRVVKYEVLARYALKEETRSIPSDRFKEVYTNKGLVEPLYNLEALARIAEINTWHSRCVKVKAHDVAGSGWGLTPTGEEEKANEQNRKTLMEFFDKLDPTLTRMLVMVAIDFESNGVGDLEIVRDTDGKPVDMTHVPSHTVRVHKDRNKFAQVVGLKTIWFKKFGYEKDVDYETGEEHELNSLPEDKRATELLHLVNYSSRSDSYGAPDILPALGAVESMLSMRDYNLKFFDNYGIPSWAIYVTGNYNLGLKVDDNGKEEGDPSYDSTTGEYEVIRIVRDHLTEVQQNPHAPLILAIPSQQPEGTVEVKFERLSVDVKDSSFNVYKKSSRDEILVAHGVPSYRVGLTETGSLGGGTAKESTDIYKTSVIIPRKEQFANEINKYIIQVGFEINDWEFYFEDFDPRDEENDRKTAEFLFARGGITPNELIAYFGANFGLKPVDGIPGMDWHYIDGKPVETGDVIREEIVESVKSLNDNILELIKK